MDRIPRSDGLTEPGVASVSGYRGKEGCLSTVIAMSRPRHNDKSPSAPNSLRPNSHQLQPGTARQSLACKRVVNRESRGESAQCFMSKRRVRC